MTILQNAAEVLRLYGAGCSDLTVTEVVNRLSMPKANASRLLKAMREAGMLETIGNTRRHRPGRMMLDLPAAFRRSSDVIGRATETVAVLGRRFGHTCYVSVLEGREITAVADFEGTNDLRVVSTIGRRLPAEKSSTGLALLARRSEAEIHALYGEDPGLGQLLDRLTRVRRDGYAYSSQESTPGVDAIGIAVADPAANEAASICISYPHAVVSLEDRNRMLAALAEGATTIALELRDDAFVIPNIPQKGLTE
ncbi:MAG: IclR family transcriptional regulator [Pseudorhodobacter sp.]